jgi:hypothetical protein
VADMARRNPASVEATSRYVCCGPARPGGCLGTPSGSPSSLGGAAPAAWSEDLVQVVTVTVGVAGPEERKHLHRLGDDPVVATMITDDGSTLRIAVAGVHRAVVMGPLQRTADQVSLEV